MNELAVYLSRKGHDVTIISGKPGAGKVVKERGYTTIYNRRLWHPIMSRIGVWEFHTFSPILLMSLLRKRYDVTLCCTFLDTYAATLARKLVGTPCVFWVNGLPPPVRYIRFITLGGAIFRRAVRDTDEVIVLSSYMQNYFAGRFGRPGIRMPVPVDIERFPLSRERNHDHPIILCASALDDKRKGGYLLMRAFEKLKRIRPDTILQVSSAVSESTRTKLLEPLSAKWRKDVHFLGAGELADLPALYGRASISVLPSLWEAFGMVIVESMASGTPVVGTRDGAIPELISNNNVGRLFEPGPSGTVEPTNEDGLVEAMIECLELSRNPDTALRCREHAEQFSWSNVGPQFEELFEQLVKERKPRVVK